MSQASDYVLKQNTVIRLGNIILRLIKKNVRIFCTFFQQAQENFIFTNIHLQQQRGPPCSVTHIFSQVTPTYYERQFQQLIHHDSAKSLPVAELW